MATSDFDTRMKEYEGATDLRLMPLLPAMARLDGKKFSTFTRHSEKPFSKIFRRLMIDTARYLVEETGARVGFTASDEITLCWYSKDHRSEIFFDGRVQKMCSTLAAMASTKFNRLGHALMDEKFEVKLPTETLTCSEFARCGLDWWRVPTFDCRVWNVPTLEEAANVFLWRQLDAGRNSVQMAARHQFSHKECLDKSTKELQEMLFERRTINWNDYDPDFKRGTFIKRTKEVRGYTAEEIESLPENHNARKDPNMLVLRDRITVQDIHLTKVSNPVECLFTEKWALPKENI